VLKFKTFKKIATITIFTLVASVFYTSLNTQKVLAASCSWNGSTSGNWATAANWNAGCSGVGGIPGNGDTLTFPSVSQTTMINNISGLTVDSLIFGPVSVVSYSLNGNSLTITSKITVNTSSSANIANIISGTTVVKDGGGTLTFSGGSTNTIDTFFYVNDGIVYFNKTSSALAVNCNLVVGDDVGAARTAQFILNSDEQISNSNNVTINGDGYVDQNGYSETIFDLIINNDGQLDTHDGDLSVHSLNFDGGKIDTGTGALSLTSDIRVDNGGVQSGVTITGSRLNLNAPFTFIEIHSGQLSALSIDSNIYGSGSIQFSGQAVGLFGDNSNFSGNILIGTNLNPTLVVTDSTTGLGDTSGQTTIADGSTLDFENVPGSVGEPIQVTGNGLGDFLGTDLGAIDSTLGVAADLTGNITLTGDTRFTTGEDGALYISGVISGNHNITIKGVAQDNLGIAFAGHNTFQGTVTVIDNGFYLQNGNAVSDDEPLIMQGDSKLVAITNELTGSISGSGIIAINSGAYIQAVYQDGTISTFSGEVTGEGDFMKYGTGELILTGMSPYFTGHLYDQEGQLTLNGNMSHANEEVQGGIFGGTGTYGIFTSQDGIINPGNVGETGILNVAGTFNASNLLTFVFNLNGTTAGSGYDQIITTEDITLNDPILNLTSGFTPSDGTVFTILKTTGGTITGTFKDLPNFSTVNIAGKSFVISYNSDSVTLTLSATLFLPTFTVTPSNAPYGTPVTIYVKWTGSGPVPIGSVEFTNTVQTLGTVNLANGEASITVSNFIVGTHIIQIIYSGDDVYGAAIPPSKTLTIYNPTSTLTTAETQTTTPKTTPSSYPLSYTSQNIKNSSSNQAAGSTENNSNSVVLIMTGGILSIAAVIGLLKIFRSKANLSS